VALRPLRLHQLRQPLDGPEALAPQLRHPLQRLRLASRARRDCRAARPLQIDQQVQLAVGRQLFGNRDG